MSLKRLFLLIALLLVLFWALFRRAEAFGVWILFDFFGGVSLFSLLDVFKASSPFWSSNSPCVAVDVVVINGLYERLFRFCVFVNGVVVFVNDEASFDLLKFESE